jgi:hypothetical protein
MNWPLVSLAHLCTPCTEHPCSKCSESLSGISFYHLLFKHVDRTSVILFRKNMVSISCFVPGFLSNVPNFTCHASQRHSSVHGLFPSTSPTTLKWFLPYTEQVNSSKRHAKYYGKVLCLKSIIATTLKSEYGQIAGSWHKGIVVKSSEPKETRFDIQSGESCSPDGQPTAPRIWKNTRINIMRPASNAPSFESFSDVLPGMVVEHACASCPFLP